MEQSDFVELMQNDFWRACDTEDWSNDEIQRRRHRNKLHFKIARNYFKL